LGKKRAVWEESQNIFLQINQFSPLKCLLLSTKLVSANVASDIWARQLYDTLNPTIIITIIYSNIECDSQRRMSNKNFQINIRIFLQDLGYHSDSQTYSTCHFLENYKKINMESFSYENNLIYIINNGFLVQD